MKHYTLLFALLLMYSCSEKIDIPSPTPSIEGSVLVGIDISMPELELTRAVGSVDSSIAESTLIRDLNIFFWNESNSYHKYYTSLTTTMLNMLVGQYNVVAIANAGKDLGAVDVNTLRRETLANLGIDARRNAIATYSNEVTIAYDGHISIPLERVYAKMLFSFTVADTFGECKLMSYRLCNIPTTVSIAAPATGTYTDPALCTTTTENFSLKGSSSAADGTYIYENRQPNVPSITSDKDRTKARAPVAATYLELFCQLSSGKILSYRIYLGEGSPSSFTIRRNVQAQYNITVYSENDARATVVSVENTVSSRLVCTNATSAYYSLGQIKYTANSSDALLGRCIPSISFTTAPSGISLQRKNGTTWANETASPQPLTASGMTATADYRAFVSTTALRNESQIVYTRTANYKTTESDVTTIWSDVQTTRIGFRATLAGTSSYTTTLKANNAAVQWADMSDGQSTLVIDADATDNAALFTIRGTGVGTFEGIEDSDGNIVSYDVIKTANSVSGKFCITQTQTYTAVWASASFICDQTNQNSAYMANMNKVIVTGITRNVTVEITYDVKDVLHLMPAGGTATETTISKMLTLPLSASNGSTQTFQISFTPYRSGTVSYTITLKNEAGIVMQTQTISQTIAVTKVKFDIALQYSNSIKIGKIASYYQTIQAIISITPKLNVLEFTDFATITFSPLGFDGYTIAFTEGGSNQWWWNLSPLYMGADQAFDIDQECTVSMNLNKMSYNLWDSRHIYAKDPYRGAGFNPTLNNLDGTEDPRHTDLLDRVFPIISFPLRDPGSCIKINTKPLPGLQYDTNYSYRNSL